MGTAWQTAANSGKQLEANSGVFRIKGITSFFGPGKKQANRGPNPPRKNRIAQRQKLMHRILELFGLSTIFCFSTCICFFLRDKRCKPCNGGCKQQSLKSLTFNSTNKVCKGCKNNVRDAVRDAVRDVRIGPQRIRASSLANRIVESDVAMKMLS